MYGLPDSWGAWAAKKAFQSIGGSGVRGTRSGGGPRTHYTYKFEKLILNRPVLKSYLNTSRGELWKVMERRARRVLAMSQRQVGVKTGALRASIRIEHKTVSYGQEVRIGSKNKIAYLHHEGTKPHLITPDRSPVLVFTSKGRVIRTQLVRHPGTKPNKYLSDQLFVFADLGTIYRGKNFPSV